MTRPRHDWLPLGNRADHYLRPSTLYALNRIIYEVLSELGLGSDEVLVVPSAYHPQNRTWQLDCVLPEVWKALAQQHADEDLRRIFIECCWFITKVARDQQLSTAFDAMMRSLAPDRSHLPATLGRLCDLKDEILRSLDRFPPQAYDKPAPGKERLPSPFSPLSTSKDEAELFTAFAAIGPSASNSPADVVSGIWSQLWSGSAINTLHTIESGLVGDMLSLVERLPLDRRSFYPGLIYQFLSQRPTLSTPLDKALAVALSRKRPWENWLSANTFSRSGRSRTSGSEQTYHQFEVKHKMKTIQLDCEFAYAAFFPTYLRTSLRRLEKEQLRKEVLCIPVYSTWVGGRSFGFLRAHLQCNFFREAPLLSKVGPALLRQCEHIANEVAQSTLARIAALPIKPPCDLIEHFVRCIVHLQDWESIAVYRDHKLQYRYRRTYAANCGDIDSPSEPVWEPCFCTADSSCRCCKDLPDDAPQLKWPEGTNLSFWDRDLLPELSDEERGAFASVSLTFEYPRTVVLPDDKEIRQRVEYAFMEEQIDVMRLLIPKVRARRAALRNAMSAVMGRNMSHNIGSHVLAQYSGVVHGERERKDDKFRDHRAEFLRYLQRRMDFIAEVATSERSTWSQPLGLRSVLEHLDFAAQCRVIGGAPGGADPKAPILLTYVSGKSKNGRPVTATVTVQFVGDDKQQKSDLYFSCPGGEVGTHALYVILENIIRNSARHNHDLPPKIFITVRVEQDEPGSPHRRLRIIDNHSSIDDEASENAATRIEKVLIDAAMLDDNNLPDPANWGVREMQICATYLRGLPLSDLEGRPRTPPVLQVGRDEGTRLLAYDLFLERARLAVFVGGAITPTDLPSGFKLIGVTCTDDLRAIAADVRGYAFAVIDCSLARTAEDLPDRNAWPMRCLCITQQELQTLVRAIMELKAAGGDAIGWLDQNLHARVMEYYQKRHPQWSGEEPRSISALVQWETHTAETVGVGALQHVAFQQVGEWVQKTTGAMRLVWLDHLTMNAHNRLKGPNGSSLDVWAGKRRDDELRGEGFEFVEGVRSASPHRNVLESLRDEAGPGGTASAKELAAAALARVIVLDERVQRYATPTHTPYEGFSFPEYWPLIGVWVPSPKTVDLNEPSLAGVLEFLNHPADAERQWPADILVIHLTILERLAKEKKKVNSDLSHDALQSAVLKEFMECAGVGKDCEFVVVTGRGLTAGAHRGSERRSAQTRFLPISAILEYLVQNPSKLMLMRALWSAAGGVGAA